VPVGAIVAALAFFERFLLPLLPVSAGQFYAFRYDGVARGEEIGPGVCERRGVEEMIREMLPDD
jgi:hypothetical protein